MPVIEISGMSKVFDTEEIETHAVNDLNLSVENGEYIAITGPSGCGKSTLMSLLGLLDTATDGKYLLNGVDVSGMAGKESAAVRNKEIGFVFQSFNLISDLTVAENIAFPLGYRKDLDKATRQNLVETVMKKVEIDHRKNHYPSQLSGGQQQRVAIARAIAAPRSIILADEPTGNLDSKNAMTVLDLFDVLHEEGTTICMVTHDSENAKRADRLIRMLDGNIQSDTALSEPRNV